MAAILVTAFLEGLCVLVVEIAGARALAPYFGTSLQVWTAQITATLLFLAVGYGAGGILCRRGPLALPAVLWVAGAWLALYPVTRTALLVSLRPLGVSFGAFVASAALFGPPLLCLGAVSPLLIARLGLRGLPGGQAAGSLFFTNTLGGLAGGWLTALVLVPHVPLRWVLAGTGVALAVIGTLWARPRGASSALWLLPLGCATLGSLAATPANALTTTDGSLQVRVVERIQSSSGALHVLELPGVWRNLLLNGVDQGAMDLPTGSSYHAFSEYLAYAAHRYHPRAKRALLLGLGCGVLAKRLDGLGMEVTAVEIEPQVVAAARKHFGLPAAVRVVIADGRAWLASERARYDVIILDAFVGESSPWYLLTREALQSIAARLAPGGRLIVNSITRDQGATAGLVRLEAALLDVFEQAVVFIEPRLPMEADDLINATLIAGSDLQPTAEPYPVELNRHVAPFVGDMSAIPPRPARRGGTVDSDDHSNLEGVDAALRLRWREKVISELNPGVLQD
jgi:spermidine synthase